MGPRMLLVNTICRMLSSAAHWYVLCFMEAQNYISTHLICSTAKEKDGTKNIIERWIDGKSERGVRVWVCVCGCGCNIMCLAYIKTIDLRWSFLLLLLLIHIRSLAICTYIQIATKVLSHVSYPCAVGLRMQAHRRYMHSNVASCV